MRPSNKELGDELVKDAEALQRLFHQYTGQQCAYRLLEAARRLQMSAGLRSVRAMKKAAMDVVEGYIVERTNEGQTAKHIRDQIEDIPLPLEEPGELRPLPAEVRQVILDMIDSLDYVDRTYPHGIGGVAISGIAVRQERIAAAKKLLASMPG